MSLRKIFEILVFAGLTAGIFVFAGRAQETLQKPELLIQTGHTDSITSIAYHPSGRFMASSAADKSVKIWDIETGTELRTFRGLSDEASAVAFSPDGRTIAAASNKYEIVFWEIETGKEIRRMQTKPETWQDRKADDLPSLSSLEGIRSIAFSPDGKRLLTGGHSNLRMWDVATGAELFVLAGHTDAILKVAFGPDGKTVASSSEDRTVRLWDAATGKEIRKLGTDMYVRGFAYNPAYQTFAAADTNGKFKIWQLTDGAELAGTDLGGYVSSLAFSRDGKTLAANRQIKIQSAPQPANGVTRLDGRPQTGDASRHEILFWDLTTGKTVRTISEDSAQLTFSPDGETVAGTAGTHSVNIKIWNVKTGRTMRTLGRRTSEINSLRFSPDGKKIGIGTLNKLIVWNLHGEISLKTFAGHFSTVYQIAFSPDGKMLASGSRDRTVRLWETESGKQIRMFDNQYETETLAFHPNGKTVAGVVDARTFFWNVVDGAKTFEFKAEGVAKQIAFSPDGTYWAEGYNTRQLRLWKTGVEKPLMELSEEQTGGSKVTFSPDGKTFASYGNTIKVFAVGSLKPVLTIQEEKSLDLNELTYSPDGRIFAGASKDNTVRLWDAKSGKLLKTLNGHKLPINSLAFSPDGKLLATGGEDTAIKLWSIETGKELVSLYAVGEKDWLAITPDGLFDGTQAAWRQIVYRFNDRTFNFAPVEAFFKEFYHPGLLEEVLQNNPPPPPEKNLAQIDVRAPGVTIVAVNRQNMRGVATGNAEILTVNQPTIKITVGVIENPNASRNTSFAQTAGARDLRLFRNGSLVKIWSGSIFDLTEKDGCKQISPTKEAPVRRTLCETEVQAVAGDNNFSSYVFNGDNVKSRDAEIIVKGADSLKRKGTLYVLAIGVNEYANQNFNLRYAVADVESIAEVLKSKQIALGNYLQTEIIKLTNQTATKANVLAALNLFGRDKIALPENAPTDLQKIKKLKPEDALVIYYAGHGTASKDSFYLIPHDGFPTEKIADAQTRLEKIYAQSVSDKDLENSLSPVDAGKIVMVIDACNSGQALESDEKRRGPMNSKGLAQLAYEKGMYILTAAQSQQVALEVSKLGHGLLTFALLEGFQKAERDNAGNITERKWLDYAAAQVPQLQVIAMQTRSAENKKLPPAQKRSELAVTTGDNTKLPPEKRGLQVPRIFYRRELESRPMIVAGQ